METSLSAHHKNVGTFIHLSTFAKFFFPFGNFIAPLILWSAQRRNSDFIDDHGRGAINFQLSILLYLVTIVIISVPFLVYFIISAGDGSESLIKYGYIHDPSDFANLSGFIITLIVAGVLGFGFFVLEIISVISAAVAASQGKLYTYPLSINFIKNAEGNQEEPLLSKSKQNDASSSSRTEED